MLAQTDRHVEELIRARQEAALGVRAPVNVERPERLPKADRAARASVPHPTQQAVPADFAPASQPASPPSVAEGDVAEALPDEDVEPELQVTPVPPAAAARVFTLTDALAYAQRHRREYQTAQEDLYLAALALTVERHLWTPIFSGNLRTVYGNFGEARNFDQAMRFVADLGVSQRLPYGGEFTAGVVSTLIRDVRQSITAAEGSVGTLALNVPLLRGAGHVARESLIQLERELTYSVRTFERFRRQQLVLVAAAYFDLLRTKQQMIDTEKSYANYEFDYQRAS
ncbi:MAG: hypothetical protein AB1716_17730, partial [Planctomycetota bacterium]